jgi:hypothetical protein
METLMHVEALRLAREGFGCDDIQAKTKLPHAQCWALVKVYGGHNETVNRYNRSIRGERETAPAPQTKTDRQGFAARGLPVFAFYAWRTTKRG